MVIGVSKFHAHAAESYEGHTIVLVQALSQNQFGVIKLFPGGRVNCVDCSISLSFTQNTIIMINGEKAGISPFMLSQMKLKLADVIVYEEGFADTINLYQ